MLKKLYVSTVQKFLYTTVMQSGPNGKKNNKNIKTVRSQSKVSPLIPNTTRYRLYKCLQILNKNTIHQGLCVWLVLFKTLQEFIVIQMAKLQLIDPLMLLRQRSEYLSSLQCSPLWRARNTVRCFMPFLRIEGLVRVQKPTNISLLTPTSLKCRLGLATYF